MANDRIAMLKLRRMLQLLAANQSLNSICSELHMSKRTVHCYKQAAQSTGKALPDLLLLTDDQLLSLLQPPSPVPVADTRKAVLDGLLKDYLSELKRPYVTVQTLWEEYIVTHPGGYQYTQFKKYLLDCKKRHEYAYHNVYAPGYELQTDLAGDRLFLTDRRTHVRTPVVVLCCIFPYSGYAFVIALMNATMENFFYGLSKAFSCFGGVPETVKTDNMKQWVRKTSPYEPAFTQATEEWCLHYDVHPEVTRVGKPTDKGSIEGFVNKMYQFIYARIRDEVFDTLDRLNNRIYELMDEFNCRGIQKKGVSRFDLFNQEEKPLLKPLPQEPYRFRYRKFFTVSSSYHVSVGSERHSYSIPYEYVSQKARVVWDMETVEIYVSGKRVVTHQRNFAPHGYTTIDEHMPANHLAYKRSKEYNAAAIHRRAMLIGVRTTEAIDRILSSRNFPQQSYKACQGVFSLASRYGEKRMETACGYILSQTSSINYTMIRNVLVKNLDKEAGETGSGTTAVKLTNEEVRGAGEYTNRITGLLPEIQFYDN
jgi:transposase